MSVTNFTDTLPASLTLNSATASGGTVATNGDTVTWNGSIPSSSMVTITIQATIGAGSAGIKISNQGTFRYDSNENNTNDAGGLTDDPNVPGLSDPTVFFAASSLMADLAVSKTNRQPDSVPGQTTTYKIVVSNSGPSNAVGAVVTDIFDAAKFDTSAIGWTYDAAAPPGGATRCPSSG